MNKNNIIIAVVLVVLAVAVAYFAHNYTPRNANVITDNSVNNISQTNNTTNNNQPTLSQNDQYITYQSTKYSGFAFNIPKTLEFSISKEKTTGDTLEFVYIVEPGVTTYPGGPPIFVTLRNYKALDDAISKYVSGEKSDNSKWVVSNTKTGITTLGNSYKAVTMALDDYSSVTYFVKSTSGFVVTIFPNNSAETEQIFANAVQVILNSIK